MKLIKRKLRSKGGASMIIALVFMLFTSFVGGSVLVSATANAYRVAQMAEQQEFLNERSAALLLGDELQLENGEHFRLNVVDAYRTIREVNVTNGGGVVETGRSAQERVITFQVTTNDLDITPMQQLMLETTVWRYLRENAAGEAYSVELVNFPAKTETGVSAVAGDKRTSKEDFWFKYTVPGAESNDYKIEGSMNVKGSATSVTLPEYTANFTSGRGTDLYDFTVDFGELSQVKLNMNAFSGTTDEITVVGATTEGVISGLENPTGYIQITTKSTQTIISWDDPRVEKGGA